MTKVTQDFEYWTGDDKTLIYTITGSDSGSVNMAGATCEWLLQDEYDSGSLLKLATGGSGITISGCTVSVQLSASDTIGQTWQGTYHTQLAASDAAGNVAVLAVGTARIHRRAY